VTLINATPAGSPGIRLLSLTVTSQAQTGGAVPQPNGFAVEDVVVSSPAGVQYHAVEIGLPAGIISGETNSAPLDEAGIVIPGGQALVLVNGGDGGSVALRRCTASGTYVIL
jgi:hypothetical protein